MDSGGIRLQPAPSYSRPTGTSTVVQRLGAGFAVDSPEATVEICAFSPFTAHPAPQVLGDLALGVTGQSATFRFGRAHLGEPPPLLLPVDRTEHRLAQTAFADQLGARGAREEDALLHLGREQQEVHETLARVKAASPSHGGEVLELAGGAASAGLQGRVPIYLSADLDLKEKALARAAPRSPRPHHYRPGDRLLGFLKSR